MKKKRKIGFALGGGGAKSFAHLGVIEVLQKNNIPIDFLATCSGGSIIGALIANKIPIPEIKREFYKRVKRISWFCPILSSKGFLSQKSLRSIILNLCGDINIENTKIPIHLVATNLNNGKLHVFKNGNLIQAVCASCAFPGIYQPIKINGQFFADGGILNNIPADICRQKMKNKNIVISISLDGHLNSDINNINLFGIIYRSIYIPLIHSRKKIIKSNSDLILDIFNGKSLNFRNWKDVLRFYSPKKMEYFFNLGKKLALKRIDEIKTLIQN